MQPLSQSRRKRDIQTVQDVSVSLHIDTTFLARISHVRSLVWYCSRGCERAASKTHKPLCSERGPELVKLREENPEMKDLGDRLNLWLKYWRPKLFNFAFSAMDLPNNDHDRLATHV